MAEILLVLRPLMMVLLLGIFVGLFMWAYAPHRRARLEECSRIPLRDDCR